MVFLCNISAANAGKNVYHQLTPLSVTYGRSDGCSCTVKEHKAFSGGVIHSNQFTPGYNPYHFLLKLKKKAEY